MEVAMRKVKSCIVCGETTTGFLFNDRWLGIPLCSKKCENEYHSTLTPVKRERMNKLRHINDLINAAKRHEAVCWAIAGFGLLATVAAFLLTDATLLLLGVLPLTCGAISTGYFEKQRNKLEIQKKTNCDMSLR